MKKHTSILACLLVLLVASAAVAQKTAQDFYRLSQERILDRDLDGALAAIQRAIELEPNLAGLYAKRSELRMMQGNLDAALTDMDKALLIDPELTPAYAERGHMRMMKGDMNGASNDFDNAIARGEKSANVFAMRGNLRLMLHDPTGALSDFNAAISMNPDRVGNYLGRAGARKQTGDQAGAMADYTAVIDAFEQKEREGTAPSREVRRVRANDIMSPVVRGPDRPKPGDPTATTKIEAVVTMNPDLDENMTAEEMEYLPNVAGAYMNRAQMRSRNAELDAALDDLNKSLAVYPHFAAYEARGKVKQRQGDLDAALDDFNKAIKIQPGMALAYLERGETLLMVGKESEAEKDFAQCLKLAPYMEKMVAESRSAAKSQKQEKP